MSVPKKAIRHKPAHQLEKQIAKEFFLRLERLLEQGRAGKEILPAIEYLSKITYFELSELAQKHAQELELTEKDAMRTLKQVEQELESGPQAEFKQEVAKLRAKLEEKVRK